VLRTSPHRLAGDRPFQALGLDSLMGLELRNRLERALGLKLSASAVWNYPTPDRLCSWLAAQLGGAAASSGGPPDVAREAKPTAAQALEDELLGAGALLSDL